VTASRQLIITADDFGLAVPVNEAVELAHRNGILTSTSLMVSAPCFEDAVDRARRLPTLAVGLHLVLADGQAVSDPMDVPDLIGREGQFRRDPVAAGIAMFCNPAARRQMEREIGAQIERFLATGLPLDHVDGHHHIQTHPTVFAALIRLAPEYGIRAVRLPREPSWASWRAMHDRTTARAWSWFAYRAMLRGQERRLRAAGIVCNDWMFGQNDAGRMTAPRLKAMIDRLPSGVTELCLHMATRSWQSPTAWPANYACVAEYEAMLDPTIAASLTERGVARVTFRDLASTSPQ
jgi:hopanoid biosynthesis associated protein HpnK